MEVKKKLKNSLESYGVALKLAIFFMLALGLQTIFCSTCLAYMSSDYLDYGIDTLSNNAVDSSYTTFLRNGLTILSNDLTLKSNILTSINNQIDTWGVPDIEDMNIFCFVYSTSSNKFVLKFFIFNNTVPHGYNFLDHFIFTNNTVGCYSKSSNEGFYQLNINFTISSNSLSIDSISPFTITGSSEAYINDFRGSFSTESDTILTSPNCFASGAPAGFAYYPLNVFTTTIPVILRDYNGNYQLPTPPEPEEPSGDISSNTGTITNNSGEITGSINLSGIEHGITGIQNIISGESQRIIDNQIQNTNTIVNTISGEVGKITNTLTENSDETIENTVITSGDIESSLGFEIAENPYSNFWTTLTNNLSTALLGSKRSIDISFQGRTWTISLDDYLVLPTWLTIILIPFSTAFFTWVLVRQWKIIFDKLSSGNIDSLLKDNSEEGISNLF